MMAIVVDRGRRIKWASALACLAVATMLYPQAAHAADRTPGPPTGIVTVHIDEAKLLKLSDRTATLVVGNPLIADVAVQPGGMLVITAKSYGVTNLIALDRSGAILAEHSIQVLGPNENIVVVYRGVERESYSCVPNCERRITLGDTSGYFSANLGQSGTLSGQAQSQGQQQQQK
jgi:Flp pilus assembly secretin CpaC